MKTGEKWARGTEQGVAVAVDGWDTIAIVTDDGTYRFDGQHQVKAQGWVKTHEADGTPVMPVPKPGEVWEAYSGCPVWIGSNGTATLPSGVCVTVTNMIFTRRMYPPMEESQ